MPVSPLSIFRYVRRAALFRVDPSAAKKSANDLRSVMEGEGLSFFDVLDELSVSPSDLSDWMNGESLFRSSVARAGQQAVKWCHERRGIREGDEGGSGMHRMTGVTGGESAATTEETNGGAEEEGTEEEREYARIVEQQGRVFDLAEESLLDTVLALRREYTPQDMDRPVLAGDVQIVRKALTEMLNTVPSTLRWDLQTTISAVQPDVVVRKVLTDLAGQGDQGVQGGQGGAADRRQQRREEEGGGGGGSSGKAGGSSSSSSLSKRRINEQMDDCAVVACKLAMNALEGQAASCTKDEFDRRQALLIGAIKASFHEHSNHGITAALKQAFDDSGGGGGDGGGDSAYAAVLGKHVAEVLQRARSIADVESMRGWRSTVLTDKHHMVNLVKPPTMLPRKGKNASYGGQRGNVGATGLYAEHLQGRLAQVLERSARTVLVQRNQLQLVFRCAMEIHLRTLVEALEGGSGVWGGDDAVAKALEASGSAAVVEAAAMMEGTLDVTIREMCCPPVGDLSPSSSSSAPFASPSMASPVLNDMQVCVCVCPNRCVCVCVSFVWERSYTCVAE